MVMQCAVAILLNGNGNALILHTFLFIQTIYTTRSTGFHNLVDPRKHAHSSCTTSMISALSQELDLDITDNF